MPFDIGFIELCILVIVGLVVLGPDKLPVAARQLSKWFRGIRRHVDSFTSEMGRELEMDELRRELEAQKKQINEATASIPTSRAPAKSAADKQRND